MKEKALLGPVIQSEQSTMSESSLKKQQHNLQFRPRKQNFDILIIYENCQ